MLHSLKTCLPLFKAGAKHKMLLLSPLPRYWLNSCCEDVEHNTNKLDEDFEEYLFSGIDGLRRQCKDFLFKNKYSGVKVLNTAQLMCSADGSPSTSQEVKDELTARWGTDPVHPSQELVDVLVENIIKLTADKGCAASAAHAAPQQQLQQAKRPRWLMEQSTVEVSPLVYNSTRGRGRGRARRGAHR